MNRMTLLIGRVKAEAWIARIKKEHIKKFQSLGANNAQTQATGTAPLSGGQPQNQPPVEQQPVVPERDLPA